MTGTHHVNPHTQGVPVAQESDIPTLAQMLPGSSDLHGSVEGENGFALFNLDWQNRRAELNKMEMTAVFGGVREGVPEPTLDDLVSVALRHKDFEGFRNQPNDFWQQVRQMSERNEIGSKYERLLSDMESSGLTLTEFVKTLPPNERQTFLARLQMDRTFGSGIFNDDGVTLSRQGQVSVLEFRAASKASPTQNPTPIIPNRNAAELPVPQKAAPLVAASRPPVPEIKATPAETHNAGFSSNIVAENTTSPQTTALRRESGSAMCGALINGAFASVEQYQNTEGIFIGSSPAHANTFGDSLIGLSAGATGSMFGAAVGGVLPGNGDDAGGVWGFVSGVVAGVDVDQGFRWLAAGGRQFTAAEAF